MDQCCKTSVVCGIACLTVLGCGPAVNFTKRSAPSALQGQSQVTLLPVTFKGLHIGNQKEQQWLLQQRREKEARHGNADVATEQWEMNKQKWSVDMRNVITTALQPSGATVSQAEKPSKGIVIGINVESIEPGYYAAVMERPSQTIVRVQVYAADKPGHILYEFTHRAESRGRSLAARVGEDVSTIGKGIGVFLSKEMGSAP